MFPEVPSEKNQVIADSVLKLSDYYIQYPSAETPWNEKFCQIAYRHYYLPLNFLRASQVVERGLKVGFFKDLSHFIDWGAGPGTASLALIANADLTPQIKEQQLYDVSESVLKNFSDLHTGLVNLKKSTSLELKHFSNTDKTCLMFSYSLTEVNDLPSGWERFEALMILEPSTSQDGRKLLALRDRLIKAGYSIWAPCTHQLSCPLLTHSKNDWCHDRVHVKAPEWFAQVENLLPMKNRTVTTSYLLARKMKPTVDFSKLARLTGDSMEEKGKTRQLVCRGENREFLTWMHKHRKPQDLNRGDLIKWPENFELKSNEIRLQTEIEVY